MRAVIHQVEGRQGVGAFPVAGRPLLVRQIQWLRAIGCDRIAVEIDSDPRTETALTWLEADGISLFVDIVLTGRPVGAREVARRVGFGDAPFLAVPADVLGGGSITSLLVHADGAGVDAWLDPPMRLDHAEQARITLYGRVPGRRAVERGVAWGTRVATFRHAHELGLAALEHRLPPDVAGAMVIHAAELRPGVWVGRGADVAADAELVAPVLVGAGACVGPGARIGPSTVLGDGAIVEAGAVVEHAHVSAGQTVSDGGSIRDAQLTDRGLRALTVPPVTSVIPGAGVLTPAPPPFAERLLAAVALLVLAPVAAVASGYRSLARALAAVVTGHLRLVGMGPPLPAVPGVSSALFHDAMSAPQGVFDIERAIVGREADHVDRARARAWYGLAKGWRLDLSLLARSRRQGKEQR